MLRIYASKALLVRKNAKCPFLHVPVPAAELECRAWQQYEGPSLKSALLMLLKLQPQSFASTKLSVSVSPLPSLAHSLFQGSVSKSDDTLRQGFKGTTSVTPSCLSSRTYLKMQRGWRYLNRAH